MALFTTKDRHEFKSHLVEIEERPVNPLGRTLFWILIALLVAILAWLFIAKIDIVVSARGKVIPDGEAKIIQPIETGVISRILVKEGQLVHKGDVLVEIDPSVTETNLESKRKNLELSELEAARLNALIEDKQFVIPKKYKDEVTIATQQLIYKTKKRAYEQQIEIIYKQIIQVKEQISGAFAEDERIKKHLETAEERRDRLKKVLDIIARNEYDDIVAEIADLEKQLNIKEHEVAQFRARLTEFAEQKLLLTQDYQNRLLEELTQKRKEAALLKAEVEAIEFKKTKQRLRSPTDGYVGKIGVHTIGGVVSPAEKLISIIPKDVPLVIKATVLNRDIGFIKKKMESAIKIDTFDFQKYGLLRGSVVHISDDAIEDEKIGPVYEVYIKPDETMLTAEASLSSGMSITAELKVGKRRVIEFFIYPMIRYLDEGLSVR